MKSADLISYAKLLPLDCCSATNPSSLRWVRLGISPGVVLAAQNFEPENETTTIMNFITVSRFQGHPHMSVVNQ